MNKTDEHFELFGFISERCKEIRKGINKLQ